MLGELRVWVLIWALMHSPSVLTWSRVDNLSGLQIFILGKWEELALKFYLLLGQLERKFYKCRNKRLEEL